MSTDDAFVGMPDNVYMFLMVLLGGQSTLDVETYETYATVLWVGHYILYMVLMCLNWPPKQICLLVQCTN